jgi:hypothetical protein
MEKLIGKADGQKSNKQPEASVSSISSGVPQNPKAIEYYPVYIKDWIPY